MECEWLGWSWPLPMGPNESTPVTVPVYVCWCDPPLIDTLQAGILCAHCGATIRIDREGGLVDRLLRLPEDTRAAVISTSESCPSCHAQLHFDTTPPDQRAGLQWVKDAVSRPPSPEDK